MEEWKEYKIGDICRIKHGFAFKGIHFVDEPQKFVCVTPGNFALKGGFKNDKPKFYNGPIPEEYVLQEDDLVVTMTDLSKNGDTLGYSALIPYDENFSFLHNQRIGLIEDISQKIDKHFLYWVMRTYDYQRYIVGHCSGSTVKHTSPSGIGSYIFRCPDLKMQKEISSVLDNLDDKIELNRRINDNLEQQAQALFKSWFVDFEPFKDGEFVESELGMIPKGWSVMKLEEFALISKMSVNPQKHPQELFKHYSIPSFDDGMKPEIKLGGEIKSNKFVIENRMTLFSKLNPRIKRVWYIDKVDLNSICSTEFIPYKPTDLSKSSFLNGLINSQGFYEFVMSMVNGATGSHQRFRPEESLNYKIAYKEEYGVKYCEVISPVLNKILENRDESRRLVELRDTLLPRLMSGELKLNEIKNI